MTVDATNKFLTPELRVKQSVLKWPDILSLVVKSNSIAAWGIGLLGR